MKKLLFACSVLFLMSSCAVVQAPISGWAYTNVKGPVTATGNGVSSKVGTAECQGILGLVTTGDASIEAAAKSAGITKIHHVDYEASNIIGIIAKYKVIVYGE